MEVEIARTKYLLLVILALGVAACNGSTPNTRVPEQTATPATTATLAMTATLEPQTTTPEIFNPLPADQRAVAAARAFLAKELGVDELTIQLVDVAAENWPDTCLGLPAIDEMCAQVITPGYKIHLKVGDAIYELHTDQSAKEIRQVK